MSHVAQHFAGLYSVTSWEKHPKLIDYHSYETVSLKSQSPLLGNIAEPKKVFHICWEEGLKREYLENECLHAKPWNISWHNFCLLMLPRPKTDILVPDTTPQSQHGDTYIESRSDRVTWLISHLKNSEHMVTTLLWLGNCLPTTPIAKILLLISLIVFPL